jgi:hypothetical protein
MTQATGTNVVIPVLVTGVQPSSSSGAGGYMGPGHKARDDKVGRLTGPAEQSVVARKSWEWGALERPRGIGAFLEVENARCGRDDGDGDG